MIRINYAALRNQEVESLDINEELLKKAKGRLGFGARKDLRNLFVPHVRLLAMEVAKREMNPQALFDAGLDGVLEALKVYDVGRTELSFKDFATPFIKRAMQSAKAGV